MSPAGRRRGEASPPPSLFGPVNPATRRPPRAPLAPHPPRAAVAAARAARAAEADAKMDRLRQMAADLARKFGLRYAVLDPERDGVNGHYGICYKDGAIRIRLRHATTGRLLKESSLVDTLCHELAHLRHFDHSPSFERLYLRILDEARRRGYYKPGPEWRQGQGVLFANELCGTPSVATRAPNPHCSRSSCCDRVSDRPSGRARPSDPRHAESMPSGPRASACPVGRPSPRSRDEPS